MTHKRILRNIKAKNENDYIRALREYYKANFQNGHSDESFLLWLQIRLDEAEHIDVADKM